MTRAISAVRSVSARIANRVGSWFPGASLGSWRAMDSPDGGYIRFGIRVEQRAARTKEKTEKREGGGEETKEAVINLSNN